MHALLKKIGQWLIPAVLLVTGDESLAQTGTSTHIKAP